MLGNITFKGIDSSSFGLLINYSDIFVKPVKRSDVISVIGKDGAQVFTDKHDPYEITLSCRLKGDIYDRRVAARNIAAWLQGIGELVLGIEQDVKYEAYAIEDIKTAPIFVLEDFTISFLVQPIKTSTLEDDLYWETADVYWNMCDVPWTGNNLSYEDIVSTDILTIDNIGNYEALPTMVISGQATTLNITDDNGITFTFSNLNGTIYVDSKNMLVYSGTTTKVNEIKDSNSEFISLNIGENTIDVVGTGFVNLDIEFLNASAYI